MKHLNITLTDEEYNELLKTKDGLSWHDFILNLIKGGSNDKKSNS
jgi:predicted CopG family antitoxin